MPNEPNTKQTVIKKNYIHDDWVEDVLSQLYLKQIGLEIWTVHEFKPIDYPFRECSAMKTSWNVGTFRTFQQAVEKAMQLYYIKYPNKAKKTCKYSLYLPKCECFRCIKSRIKQFSTYCRRDTTGQILYAIKIERTTLQ